MAGAADTVEVTRNTPYENLPQWMSVTEVAAHLGLTPWTVYQLVRNPEERVSRLSKRFGKTIKISKEYVKPNGAQLQVTP